MYEDPNPEQAITPLPTTSDDRVMSREKVGFRIPRRNPAHEDPQWFECDLDDAIEDPDEPFIDPLPTERHRTVP